MKWRDIWKNKVAQRDFSTLKPYATLAELLRLNGFDSGSGTFYINDYLSFMQKLIKDARLNECESIFEVGCGSGAFLYGLQLERNKVEGGGECLLSK